MQNLRIFTELGNRKYGEWIDAHRKTDLHETSLPEEFLWDDELTTVVDKSLSLEAQRFDTKADLAEWLKVPMASLDRNLTNDTDRHRGYNWLTALCFDNFRSKNMYALDRWVFNDKSRRHDYKHLLFGPYRIMLLQPDYASVVLSSPTNEWSQVLEQISARPIIMNSNYHLKLIVKIFMGEDGNFIEGISGHGNAEDGNIACFAQECNQFAATYELAESSDAHLRTLFKPEYSERI